jgi:pectinesterase
MVIRNGSRHQENPRQGRSVMKLFTFLPLACALFIGMVPAVHAGAVVAADGSGDFKTVQEAVNASPQDTGSAKPWIIMVKPGTCKERVYVQREKRFLHLVGEDAARTVISFGLHANLKGPDDKPIGTFRTPTVQIDADDFTAENLTFENSAGNQGQALAVRLDGDRLVFRHCRFLGWQDTILANRGRHYFEDCHIAGACDFIFGGATAYFEKCRLHCLGRGYITAASTPSEQTYGFVFAHCQVTAEAAAANSFLGRPWRSHAGVVFLDTELPAQICPAGWDNWRDPAREQTARFAEFNSTGPGANPAGRVKWSRQLDAKEAGPITAARVLRGSDGWDPGKTEKANQEKPRPE